MNLIVGRQGRDQKREPRRLFYVGVTRAGHEVDMTYSGFTTDGYRHKHHNGLSEFLLEVAARLQARPPA